MKSIRIGTRGSDLALWQANEVARRLRDAGVESSIHILKTTGDRHQDVSLASIGGKGLFIKEIEDALDRGEVDIGVHSLKDVPSVIPDRFALVSFLERADPRDAWIQIDGRPIEEMPEGSVIATSSPRRAAQLRHLHPRFRTEPVRGNVDTRIRKLHEKQYDAAVLASAGLTRLGRDREITSWFPVETMIPAAGQGIVAIEVLTERPGIRDLVERINHAPTALAARSERGLLQKFEHVMDCYSAVGAHARRMGELIEMRVFVSDPKGERVLRLADREPEERVGVLIDRMAETLKGEGAVELLQSAGS